MISPVGRRHFLKTVLAGTATAAWCGSAIPADPSPDVVASGLHGRPEDVKQLIRGPILSIPTPFTDTFDVDFAGVRRMITRAVEHGIRVFSLTPGNSYYHALSYEEVKELTRVMVEAVDGRGVTIAAADAWWTGQAVAYAEYARSIGADAVQVTIPTRADLQGQAAHFRSVADACGLGIVIHGVASFSLLDALCKINGVIALKEDATLIDYIEQQRRFGDRLAIFAGGPKYRYLVAEPYGSPAFYSLYATFAPQVPMLFWEAIQADDRETAYDIVKTYEFPFFDRWSHGMWRASLEHFGVAQRYLRPPEKSFTPGEMLEVKAFFDGLGLQPEM